MKIRNYLTILSVLISLISLKGQVVFTYDAGGNMIERKIQIINPNARINPSYGNEIKDSTISFKIYPNPTNDFINIEGRLSENETQSKVFLRNNNGMLVREETYDGTFKSIKVSDLAAGIYFVEIKYEKKKSANYKIIITN